MNSKEKIQSVLFAEVSGSARLHEKLGDAEALRAVDRCLKRMERGVEGFGGRIVKTAGGELMAVFGLPDDASQSAIEMQHRVAALPPVSGVKLAIRVGFSHGPVSEEDGEFVGDTVNAAAHLAGLAKPGQILTSIQALAALSPAFKLWTRDLGSAAGKGKEAGIKVFEVALPEVVPPAANNAAAADKSQNDAVQGARLYLRYNGEVIILDDRKPVIQMGRGTECDILIRDRRSSRLHASIERSGDVFVLLDKSTNGTYVTLSGEPELLLRGEECVIRGKGVICFAGPATSTDADFAEFEQI